MLSKRSLVTISMQLQKTTLTFFYRLARLLAPLTEYNELAAFSALVFAPFEVEIRRFAVLEKSMLAKCIGALASKSHDGQLEVGEGGGVEPLVDWMTDSLKMVVGEVDGVVNRCLEFTGNAPYPHRPCNCGQNIKSRFFNMPICICIYLFFDTKASRCSYCTVGISIN